MKTTLNTRDIADALKSDANADWSHAGAQALAEYLEEIEEAAGVEMELDVCAIRCDYSEYESALKAARDNGNDWTPETFNFDGEEELEEHCLEWLRDRAQVIEFDGGIIVSSF